MNTTANTLARQAFNSNAFSTNYSCSTILDRELRAKMEEFKLDLNSSKLVENLENKS